MTEPEKISAKKAFKGVVEPKNYVKAGVFSVNIGIMILLVLGAMQVFSFFFGGKNTSNQTSTINIAKGASVGTLQLTPTQETSSRRSVGLEGAVSSQDADITFVKYFSDRLSVGAGLRYRFDAGDNSEFAPVVKLRFDFY